MKDFRGTYTIMVTPFDAEGAVDVPALERYVDWQIESGIHGLIPLGSTGEFLSMTDDEIELVAKTVIDRAARRVPVIIGTTAEDTRVAARKSRMAESLGADGVMVLPPFYCTPTEDELYQHDDREKHQFGRVKRPLVPQQKSRKNRQPEQVVNQVCQYRDDRQDLCGKQHLLDQVAARNQHAR